MLHPQLSIELSQVAMKIFRHLHGSYKGIKSQSVLQSQDVLKSKFCSN